MDLRERYSAPALTPPGVVQQAVSFHNFKSQNFKLSVSNPKNKYVAYVSVLSQIFEFSGSRQQKQTCNFEN